MFYVTEDDIPAPWCEESNTSNDSASKPDMNPVCTSVTEPLLWKHARDDLLIDSDRINETLVSKI